MKTPNVRHVLVMVTLGVAAPAAVAVAGTGRPLTLTCSDESPPSVSAGPLAARIGPLALDGARSWAAKPPTGIAFAYNKQHYRLLKAFAYVSAKPRATVTMRIVTPRTGASLYYAAGPAWASSSPRSIIQAARSTVTFTACDGPTGYTGGFLVSRAACITVSVSEPGMRSTTAHLSIAPAHCR